MLTLKQILRVGCREDTYGPRKTSPGEPCREETDSNSYAPCPGGNRERRGPAGYSDRADVKNEDDSAW